MLSLFCLFIFCLDPFSVSKNTFIQKLETSTGNHNTENLLDGNRHTHWTGSSYGGNWIKLTMEPGYIIK